ncbi:MAG: hypothetical protein ACTS2F_04335 [Thainema sp.]
MIDPTSASNSHSDEDWLTQANQQQMFTLIEQLLPLEACLYYRVLPLSLDGSRLNLGMVDPDDKAAADYVRRLLSYINCSIVPRPISLDGHHAMLTQYLNYSQRGAPALSGGHSASTTNQRTPAHSFPVNPDQNQQRTFIVDSPEQIEELEDLEDLDIEFSEQFAEPTASAWLNHEAELDQTLALDESEFNQPIIPEEFQSPNAFTPSTQAKTPPDSITHEPPENYSDKNFSSESIPNPFEPPHSAVKHANTAKPSAPSHHLEPPSPPGQTNPLELSITSFSLPLDSLPQQQPKTILYELLGQVLKDGIGRLYFEHHQHQGRILWSQDGVMQSAIEKLDVPRFEGVVSELKRLAGLPMLPVQSIKQIELERIYQGSRLLLRFRVMPGKHGEEATLQVLRGAALKFYERQIINRLGRDALGLAYKLQQQLNEIRSRARDELAAQPLNVESLPALRELLKQLDQQIQELIAEQGRDRL